MNLQNSCSCDYCKRSKKATICIEVLRDSGHEESAEFINELMEEVEHLGAQLSDFQIFTESFLDPERFGHSVTAEVRDEARKVLGMKPVEVMNLSRDEKIDGALKNHRKGRICSAS